MNRETKFRVWDKENNKWIDTIDIAINQKGLLFLRAEHQVEFQPISLTKSSNFIVVFYTGLKDKNEKEIYEGDIVKFETHNGQGVVIYNSPRFEVKERDTDETYSLQGYECEVIGNIYENKELLK